MCQLREYLDRSTKQERRLSKDRTHERFSPSEFTSFLRATFAPRSPALMAATYTESRWSAHRILVPVCIRQNQPCSRTFVLAAGTTTLFDMARWEMRPFYSAGILRSQTTANITAT